MKYKYTQKFEQIQFHINRLKFFIFFTSIQCHQEQENKKELRLLQIPSFDCTSLYQECAQCDAYKNERQLEIKCRLCVFKNTQKIYKPNGSCSKIPDSQTINIWCEVRGCDSEKCVCSSQQTTAICKSCKDTNAVIYPDFQSCDAVCIAGRFLKGNICLKCDPNGQYMSEQDNSCQLCTQAFSDCNECDIQQCFKCKNGYGLDYLNSFRSPCIDCRDISFLQVGKYCIKKPTGCQTITESSIDATQKIAICDVCVNSNFRKLQNGSCAECEIGTFYNQILKDCSLCSIKNCKYCPQDICTSCQPGFHLNNRECVQNLNDCVKKNRYYVENEVCKECEPEKYYISDCTNFDNFCGMCLPCKTDKSQQNSFQCQECPFQCKTCNNSACITCLYPGQNINQIGTCGCFGNSNCLECNLSGCFRCPIGYSYNNKKKGCEGTNQPPVCPPSFKLEVKSDTKCYCSTPNCKYCDFDSGDKCIICDRDYILNKTTNQCEKCPLGSIYDKSTLTCLCSVTNCQQCQPDNVLKCQICNSNYELTNSGFCKKCINNYTYISSEQKCLCQDNNCVTCDPADGALCIDCSLGYELNSTTKTCVEKPKCLVQNCQRCIANSINQCLVCNTGYSVNSSQQCEIQIISSCSLDNCKSCPNDVCILCYSGYTLNNGKCVQDLQNCPKKDRYYLQNGECKKCGPTKYFLHI